MSSAFQALDNMNTSYAQIIFGYMMYTLSPYFMVFVNIALQAIGIHQYTIEGDTRKISKHLEKTVNTTFIYRNHQMHKSGYFFSLDCIGVYQEIRFSDENMIIMYCSPTYFASLVAEEPRTPEIPCKVESKSVKTVRKFNRTGTFKNFYYVPLKIDVTSIQPIGSQISIVNSIVDLFRAKQRAAVFIHGVTGAGKSTIGYLVAKALDADYCNTFKPTDAGDSFPNLINDIQNRSIYTTPLVIMLDEVNIMINAIHTKTVEKHREIPIPISDKADWTNLFDDLVFHKNIILIMTSNESKEAIDSLDTAYLRPGRIDNTYSMLSQIESEI